MKFLRFAAQGAFLSVILSGFSLFAQGSNTTNNVPSTNNVTGQWDFDQGDLRATIGTALQYLGDTASVTTFSDASINGSTAKVMHFPAASPTQGYLMFHGAKPNGGGTNVNEYTIILDLMWPDASDGTFRALFKADTNINSDASMFVSPDNGIGVQNDYAGEMVANTWYRLGLVFDLTNGVVNKYLNGTNVETQCLFANCAKGVVDSQFSLGPALLLFADDNFETGEGIVNSIQFRDTALTDDQMRALGGPAAGGLSGGPGGGTNLLHIETIQKNGNTVQITSSGGGNIELQKKVTLNDANWLDVTNSTTGNFSVISTNKTAFFRLKQL